jgi:pimeloyl-ACP methyl ester carboxylesterase
MKSKRRTTMAKLARERLVQERRALKREKKRAAAAAAREARAGEEGSGPERSSSSPPSLPDEAQADPGTALTDPSPASRDQQERVATTDTESDRIPLMLIHGAWLSARSWENYADYFGKRGFAVTAPEWPRKHGDVEQLREEAEELKDLGLGEIVDHHEALIRELDQPPVLIGHSYGGLIVELLLERGLGRAGVALSPAPPKGILVLPFSTLKAAAPALAHPSKWHGVVTLTPEEFTYAFVNTFSPEKAAEAYERYAVPETGQIFYEAGFANFHLHPPTQVHFKNEERAPLLIVGAEKDHTVPASLSKAQYKRYERSSATTDYLEFEGRPHLHMAAEDWEEVTAAIDSWLDGVLEASATPAQGVSA